MTIGTTLQSRCIVDGVAKAAGLSPKAMGRIREDTPRTTEKQTTNDRRSTRKGQAEDLPGEGGSALGEVLQTDLGPWAEPSSTRVKAYRYDYLKKEIQVTWVNNNNPGYAYGDMDYEGFRAFARIASKGKYINRVLNGMGNYRRLTPDEVNAPSNRNRRSVTRNRSE
jgi:hypothetical protein